MIHIYSIHDKHKHHETAGYEVHHIDCREHNHKGEWAEQEQFSIKGVCFLKFELNSHKDLNE